LFGGDVNVEDRATAGLETTQHHYEKLFEKHEKLQQELAELRAAYNERGMAMQQTGKMVRSLYAPENERLNKENGIMEKALRLILDEVGTSTLTNKIASEALDKIKRIRNGN
jgi:cell division septum initiation protein DivIVA